MARFDDHDTTVGADLYAELLTTEEEKFARRRGRYVLVGDEMVIVTNPGPVLTALRAVSPSRSTNGSYRVGRSGRLENRLLTVYPDGRVVKNW